MNVYVVYYGRVLIYTASTKNLWYT